MIYVLIDDQKVSVKLKGFEWSLGLLRNQIACNWLLGARQIIRPVNFQ